MEITHNALPGAPDDAVRLIGMGLVGQRFVSALHRGARGPLADLLGAGDHGPKSGSPSSTRGDPEIEGVVILFVAFGSDASDAEAAAVWSLVRRAQALEAQTIGIVIQPATTRPVRRPVVEELDDAFDGRIEISAAARPDQLDALRWLFGGLRSLARDGSLILEPGWDLADVVEVLGLPWAELRLATQSIAKGVPISAAVAEALESLAMEGVDLALASGVLLVLWRAPDQTLYVRDVRDAAHVAALALGQGGLHLTLTARSKVPWGEVGGCATVVVSSPRRRITGGPSR